MPDTSLNTPVQPLPPPNGTASALGPLATPASGAAASGGMDRRKPKRRFPPRRVAIVAIVGLAVVALVYMLLTRDGRRRLTVEGDRLTISTVQRGAFQEFVAVTGTVQPERTVFLDAVVGGQVAQKLVEEGAYVVAGQPLLVLTNDNLTLQMMSSEAQLQEQLSTLRSTRLALDQNALNLAQQMTELDYNLVRLRRERDRLAGLAQGGYVAQQEYERVRDEYDYTTRRRALTQQGHRQDSLNRAIQLNQMAATADRLTRNLGLVQQTMSNLVVRAPVAGQLTTLTAEIGQSLSQGARVGQVDVVDAYKVRVPVDEHYLARVAVGQRAVATVDGNDYMMTVSTVYPAVRDGRFEVDMTFAAAPPESIRRGQSLRIRLELGDPEQALLLARGGFYQTSGGNWAYVVEGNGKRAVRRSIRLGRQNPQYYEVTEGLRPGDRVVTSSYDTFGDAEVLVLQ